MIIEGEISSIFANAGGLIKINLSVYFQLSHLCHSARGRHKPLFHTAI